MVYKGWRASQSFFGCCNGSTTGNWVEADGIVEEVVEEGFKEVVEEVVEETVEEKNADADDEERLRL